MDHPRDHVFIEDMLERSQLGHIAANPNNSRQVLLADHEPHSPGVLAHVEGNDVGACG